MQADIKMLALTGAHIELCRSAQPQDIQINSGFIFWELQQAPKTSGTQTFVYYQVVTAACTALKVQAQGELLH